jgi:hypothetical protein
MSDSAPTTHSSQSLLLYKITTSVTYLLLVITTFYYTFNAPDKHDGRFWKHNLSTPFAQSSIITSIYWLVLFALQLAYAWSLYASNPVYVSAAANVGAHFVANNLLLFGFVNLFVRSHYILALVLLLINFFNLSFAYFRHSTTPRAIHIGVVSGPLAWNFVALYWVGALVVHTNHLAARIVANVFIWGWAGYGVFFLAAYKDYTMGYALSILSFCKFFALPFSPPLLIFASPSFQPSSSNISAKSMNSNRDWPGPHTPPHLPIPMDLRLHHRRPALRALHRRRRSRPTWPRPIPAWPNCGRGSGARSAAG